MAARTLAPAVKNAASKMPVVVITGPRQSGKTTLARSVFPRHEYVSLEDLDERQFAMDDPRGFLGRFRGKVILDEIQRVPDLFSYLQTEVDRNDSPGRFVLTGSQNFLLLGKVSQTLAGRAAIQHLLPFSLSELEERAPFSWEKLGLKTPARTRILERDLAETLFAGFYPRIHDKHLDPRDWCRDYVRTYVERDVRDIVNVGDAEAFGRFLRLCAARSGQLLNQSSLASDCGITHTTVARWISILEASFIVHLLRPHHENLGKRLIKSPKLHFLDTGLLCYLLGIRDAASLRMHSLRGAVFESFVVSEALKHSYHRGEEPRIFFWRDSTGHEIDLLIERDSKLVPVEIKSGETLASDAFKGLRSYLDRAGDRASAPTLIWGGRESYAREGISCVSWSAL